MSRTFDGDAANYIRNDTLSFVAPFTVAAWVMRFTAGQHGGVFAHAKPTGGSKAWFGMDCLAGNGLRGIEQAPSTVQASTTNTHSTTDDWLHGFVSWADNNQFVMLDGDVGNAGTDTAGVGNLTTATDNDLGVVNDGQDDRQLALDGLISWMTVWGVELSNEEGVQLANGRHPRTVRPDDIILCLPLWGEHSPEIDMVGGAADWTVNGTVAADIRQPPMEVWTPHRKIFSLHTEPAVVGGSWFAAHLNQRRLSRRRRM